MADVKELIFRFRYPDGRMQEIVARPRGIDMFEKGAAMKLKTAIHKTVDKVAPLIEGAESVYVVAGWKAGRNIIYRTILGRVPVEQVRRIRK